MDGNKPKQQVEKPIDNQTNLNLKSDRNEAKVIEIDETDLNEEFQMPDYRPKSLFTRKQVSRAKKNKLKKIAYASKRKNRLLGK